MRAGESRRRCASPCSKVRAYVCNANNVGDSNIVTLFILSPHIKFFILFSSTKPLTTSMLPPTASVLNGLARSWVRRALHTHEAVQRGLRGGSRSRKPAQKSHDEGGKKRPSTSTSTNSVSLRLSPRLCAGAGPCADWLPRLACVAGVRGTARNVGAPTPSAHNLGSGGGRGGALFRPIAFTVTVRAYRACIPAHTAPLTRVRCEFV